MKLNRKWLNEEFVDLSHVSDKEYVEKLTVFGQKVETWERMDAEIKNVKVGKVVSIVRHTNSDHMWVCQVDVGEEEPLPRRLSAEGMRRRYSIRLCVTVNNEKRRDDFFHHAVFRCSFSPVFSFILY